MRYLWLLFFILCIGVSHSLQTYVDEKRFARKQNTAWYYLPSPSVTSIISLGQSTFAADFLWLRTCLLYADFINNCTRDDSLWLYSMIDTISYLDPTWRTNYLMGGTMLSVCEQYDLSDKVFEKGHKHLPNEPYFPFAIASTASLEHQDYEKAVHWMKIASETPNAPAWYRANYAGLLEKSENRDISINYLRQQIATQNNQTIKDYLINKYQRLLHEVYQDNIRELRHQFQIHFQRDITEISELQISLEDPFGIGWTLSKDGEIRSLHLEEILIKKHRNKERHWIKEAKQIK